MSSSASEARDTAGGRLGGARADFVASLGRKVSDARELLTALEDDPSSKPARDELRRRLHALGSGARLLRFEAMARSLQDVLGVLDRTAQSGGLRDQDVSFLAQVLDDLPALAWGDTPPRETVGRRNEEADDTPAASPISVLVVGAESLADALTEEGAIRARAFECERAPDAQTALQIARAYAPDLVLLDADAAGASTLVEALLDDPLTEPVPVVVVGTFAAPEDAARFIALGVAKTLARPIGADVIRHACDEVLDAREGRTVRVTLGEPTLEQLADRLAGELRSALVESVDRTARSHRVPLGEGTEVLGALWGAIARVQEIVSQKTKGAIRFGGDTPEGAIALAPWLHHEAFASDRVAGRGRGAAADVRLNGRRVVVADDDPGVTWFISDLLRTAGCEVHEALDGITALHLAFRVQPELVVSDILMPGLDGFALCRALKRDVALRDTPVMLLSWKEDLLQRVRELGASAAAYMRKESDSRAVLARVREVLRPRARIEMRLRGDGEVRGRLDDLSPRLLLELVCAIRKNARVAVRDATFLYEIDIRDGAPRKATRAASDGSFQSGERALAMLLGVGAGRFVVSSTADPIRGDLTGTLSELLIRPLAAARGAIAAMTGVRTMELERILLDQEVIDDYLRATPDPARAIIRRLAEGASPRQILLAGEAPPSLLEDVLSDLAARCAVTGVQGAGGTDLLTPAVEAALAVLTGAPPDRRSLPPNARASILPRAPAAAQAPAVLSPPVAIQPPVAIPAPAPRPEPVAIRRPDPASVPRPEPAAAPAPARVQEPPLQALTQLSSPWPAPRSPIPFLMGPGSEAPANAPSEPPLLHLPDEDGPPSSLEDAVMREISDRSPDPGTVQGGLDLPPIIEPSELRPRSSNPPPPDRDDPEYGDSAFLPSIPPDAIVPGATSNEEFAVVPAAFGDLASAFQAEDEDKQQLEPALEEEVQEVAAVPEEPEELARPRQRAASERRLVIVRESSPIPPPPDEDDEDDVETLVRDPSHVAAAPSPPAPPKLASAPPVPPKSGGGLVLGVVAFLLLGGVVVAVLRMSSPAVESPTPRPPAPTVTATASAVPPAPPPPTTTAVETATGLAPPAASDDVPTNAGVPPGYGILEIAAPAGARVRVDGADVGTGPLASRVLRAGYHQVRVDQGGRNTQYVIEVRAGKTTHVKSAALP